MAFSSQSFVNGNALNDSDLNTMDGNIDEVRSSHKGAAQPPSLTLGTRWIDDSTAVWSSKVYDGGAMLTESRIYPSSDLVMPAELRRKNLVWNGALDVWQDGVSETGITASNNRVADGWRFVVATHGTWTVDRSAFVPTVAQAGRNLNYSIRAACPTADTTVAAGSLAALRFTVEGYDYQELYQQPQHLSFWVRSTLTGTYGVSLRNSGFDRSFVFTYSISVANTWELKEFVLRDAPSGGTWDFTNGAGIDINFTLAAGSTFQTTANAWQTGNFFSTSGQVNLAALNTHAIHITDVRLHGGTIRSPVIVRSFNEMLSEAKRRFWKTFAYGTKPAQNVGSFAGTVSARAATATDSPTIDVRWPSQLQTSTVTTYNPTVADANWRNSGDSVSATASVSFPSADGVRLQADSSGSVATWHIHVTADARFT